MCAADYAYWAQVQSTHIPQKWMTGN